MRQKEADFVWYDSKGEGRNLYAMFRKKIVCEGTVKKAVLNIFADSSYQLFINGEFVEFGPVRFDPRFPLYDTHDISKFIIPGANVIAVLVNYYGSNNFFSIRAKAGMKAWGAVETHKGEIFDLNSHEGSWKCKEAKAYSRYAPKASFALNPVEIFDQGRDESGWKDVDYDDMDWPGCVKLEDQDAWGELKPRSIPFMSGKPVPVQEVANVLPLYRKEDLYSFELPVPFIPSNYLDLEKRVKKDYSSFVAYSTWIYSPEDQVVNAGVYFGDNWINGEKVPRGVESENKSMRFNETWKLKQGWNYYFGCVEVYQDVLQHYIALPSGKGLVVSADRRADSPYIFRHTPILKNEDYDKYLKNKPLPYSYDDTLDEIGGWVYARRGDFAGSASRETAWEDYGEPVDSVTPESIQGFVLSRDKYPDGFSITLSLGHMHLVFPRIQLEGVKGAVVDVTYTEHLNRDNLHFRFRRNAQLGDRILCSEDAIDWMPAHPRGFQYIKISVRNIGGDVKIKGITFRSANYPVENKGRFECSDPLLNAIWEMGRRTQAANMEDAYVDTPLRERGLYVRDSIIQYHVNLAAFGDHALMRRCLELFGQTPDEATGKFRACCPIGYDYTISDFSLNMLEGFHAYYKNTGDIEIIEKYWDAMINNLEWFHRLADERSDMLLDAEWDVHKGVLADYGGFHGDLQTPRSHMAITGIHCVFSLTYLIALKCAAELGEVIGKSDDVKKLEQRIAVLSRSVPEAFWDPEKKCFADNLERDTHSIHANLFAVRAGVVNTEQLEHIKSYVRRQLKNLFINGYSPEDGALMSPNYAFYIFDGLYKAGMPEIAESIMKQGWGWVLTQGLKTCPEYFTLTASHCHAWSASPTYYLSKYVLGINFPCAPDLSKVEINVQTSCIDYADGAYPHPSGLIEVKWHMENGKRVFDHIKAPEGVEVRVIG